MQISELRLVEICENAKIRDENKDTVKICKKCDKIKDINDFSDYMDGQRYRYCLICRENQRQKTYDNRKERKREIRGEQKYYCELCSFSAINERRLQIHTKTKKHLKKASFYNGCIAQQNNE